MTRVAVIIALAAPLAACATRPSPAPVAQVTSVEAEPAPVVEGWRAIASAEDQARLDQMPQAWARARAAVPRRLSAKLKMEGSLLDPAAALELPALPPGPYRCRLVRFGGRVPLASFKPDFCYVTGDAKGVAFTKQDGQTLPGGWIYEDTPTRQVLLGGMRAKPDEQAPAYGGDPARDVAAVIERVAPFRWRLILARPGRGALLDVYELVPVPPEVPGATPAVAGS